MTSRRAKASLAILVLGYVAIAVVAGAPNSPLTVLLPEGAEPPTWASGLARSAGLDGVGRVGLTGVAWILVLVVLAAFAVVIGEAWSRRLELTLVLGASAISIAIAVAAPLLLSRDVYTYAAYGRIFALHHHNPYTDPLSSFPRDPFVAVTPGQWLHTHSHYGPLFTLASAGIARTWAGSETVTIFAFKALAGVAILAATALVALTAHRTRPERAPLATALVGLNPVLVVHTVGGGHVDALIAVALAAASVLAIARPPALSLKAIGITALLTVACLVKAVIAPALVLWLWWMTRAEPAERRRNLVLHSAVAAGLVGAATTPFFAGWHTLTPFTTLGGVEAWASPSHLVGSAARVIAGSDAARVVEGLFLLLFVVCVWRLVRRATVVSDLWGIALLALPLSMPYLLPWYAAWFAPFLGLLTDDALVLVGTFATGVLALTLIPADPFHGLTTPAVMDGVHYAAASALLVAFLFVVSRILGIGNRSLALRATPV